MHTANGVAVTGGRGYLGRQVIDRLPAAGLRAEPVDGRCEELPSGSIPGRVLVHCAGRLRGAPADVLRRDNVAATAGMLAAVRPETLFAHASSRAVHMSRADGYAASKKAAERLVAARDGPGLIVRYTVLTGPSGDDCGGSFLTTMVRNAVTTGTVRVPRTGGTIVDCLDVRDAAQTFAAVAAHRYAAREPIDATTGAVDLDEVVETLRAVTAELTGRTLRVEHADLAGQAHLAPADPGPWWGLRRTLGLPLRTPLRTTIHDTAATILRIGGRLCHD